MTCIHTRSITPQFASYEMSPPATSIRFEDSAPARSRPRAVAGLALPITTEQRGPFATHASLLNPAQPSRLTRLNESSKPLEEVVMEDQFAAGGSSEPSSPLPRTRLSVLDKGGRLADRDVVLGKVDQFVADLSSTRSSPPPSRLSVLNEGARLQDRDVMQGKIDQFIASLSA